MLLEICTDSLESSIIAEQAGANRIELNYALELGGLTPSIGLVKQVLNNVSIPVIVMLRPRAGLFEYSENEFVTILKDCIELSKLAISGVACGFTKNNQVDLIRTKQLVELTEGKEIVFHRAFDLLPNHLESMEQLIDCGVNRILTSGCSKTALDGYKRISELIKKSDNRIEILPGSGIRHNNVAELIRRTGATQVHSSCSIKIEEKQPDKFGFGNTITKIDSKAVSLMKEELSKF